MRFCTPNIEQAYADRLSVYLYKQRSVWPTGSLTDLTSETETEQPRRALDISLLFFLITDSKKRKSEDVIILSKQRDKSVIKFDGFDPLLALTCWGSMGKTNGPGIHNGSCGPSRAPWCIAAGQTHGSCQNCRAVRWCWGGRTPQSEECRPAAYWSPQTASSGRGKRQNS